MTDGLQKYFRDFEGKNPIVLTRIGNKLARKGEKNEKTEKNENEKDAGYLDASNHYVTHHFTRPDYS